MSSYIPDHWDIYGSGDGGGVQYVKVSRSSFCEDGACNDEPA
jgi:hypothetical protein